jgi:tetratricopeptide (TPR) repeat protein
MRDHRRELFAGLYDLIKNLTTNLILNLIRENRQMTFKTLAAIAIQCFISLSAASAVFAAESDKEKAFTPPAFPFRKAGVPMDAWKLPDNDIDSWNKGELAFRSQDYKGASEQFKKVVAANPKYSRGYERLGSAQAASDDYDSAVTSLNKAIELDAKDYLPHLILGRVILVKKGETAGVAEAQKAYDINPWACAAFLDFANKDRFDEHKWFVLANYWKEMEVEARQAPKKSSSMMPQKVGEACCAACAEKGMMGSPEDCAKAKAAQAAEDAAKDDAVKSDTAKP